MMCELDSGWQMGGDGRDGGVTLYKGGGGMRRGGLGWDGMANSITALNLQ